MPPRRARWPRKYVRIDLRVDRTIGPSNEGVQVGDPEYNELRSALE
jgi:hypothetical protein